MLSDVRGRPYPARAGSRNAFLSGVPAEALAAVRARRGRRGRLPRLGHRPVPSGIRRPAASVTQSMSWHSSVEPSSRRSSIRSVYREFGRSQSVGSSYAPHLLEKSLTQCSISCGCMDRAIGLPPLTNEAGPGGAVSVARLHRVRTRVGYDWKRSALAPRLPRAPYPTPPASQDETAGTAWPQASPGHRPRQTTRPQNRGSSQPAKGLDMSGTGTQWRLRLDARLAGMADRNHHDVAARTSFSGSSRVGGPHRASSAVVTVSMPTGGRITMSTRRLESRPPGVSLLPTGRCWP